MKMEKNDFIKTLIDKAKENNIALADIQAEKLYLYKELLLEWNEKINLTSIIEDEDIIVKHFIDSLLSIEYIEKNTKIIDVGTGAGFPGIVLAIYFDGQIEITLLDSLQKRVNFLNLVIQELGLNNIQAIHGRAEEFAHKEEYREKYDIAIARAVAPLNILLEYLSGYVKVSGKCVCMKSVSADEEIQKSTKAFEVLKVTLEGNYKKTIKHHEDITRTILVFDKNNQTPNKYPRSYGKIKKAPL